MERLKTILADKILDLTSSGNDDVKIKIDKMHRFRDFANACQTLMIKYPQIEDELIKMVNDGDFDTKVASSRVDSVIRMADLQTMQSPIEGNVVGKDNPEENTVSDLPLIDKAQEELPSHPEDVDYEEISSVAEEERTEKYTPYENVNDDEVVVETEIVLSEEELATAKRKTTIKRVLQIVGVLLIVALLIVAIKFVMAYWQTILIVLGVALLILIVVWFLSKKKK